MPHLPELARFVSTYPTPDAVVSALAGGLLQPYGARVCCLWVLQAETLVLAGSTGVASDLIDRFAVMPMYMNLRMWDAVHSAQVVVTPASQPPTSSAGPVAVDTWNQIAAEAQGHTVLRAPLTYADQCVGTLGVILDRAWPQDEMAPATLDAARAILATWIGHPRSNVLTAARARSERASDGWLTVTPRQVEVLRRVLQGASNPAIAGQLSVSESSVKQDLQRAMRTFGCHDRAVAAERAARLGLFD